LAIAAPDLGATSPVADHVADHVAGASLSVAPVARSGN
jgi:hypothetical protein